MNYNLAKKLKEAGFPQRSGGLLFNVMLPESPSYFPSYTFPESAQVLHPELFVTCPTLDELIEACGDGFSSLGRADNNDKQWMAFTLKELEDKSNGRLGSTPSEAVANLWLCLFTQSS